MGNRSTSATSVRMDGLSTVGAFGRHWLPAIDLALVRSLGEEVDASSMLAEPAGYWFRFKGRRFRPLALLAACELVGGRPEGAVDAACIIELIHTSSLILDDLPCMDDSAERRGVASLHRVYGDATALLTALLLLNLAHRRLARLCAARGAVWHERICELLGNGGMIGGQDIDLRLARGDSLPAGIDGAGVRLRKTTSLTVAALELGAFLGGAPPSQVDALGAFGAALGRLVQAMDDLVDGDRQPANGRHAWSPDAILSERRRATMLLHDAFPGNRPARRVLEGLVQFVVEQSTAPVAMLHRDPVPSARPGP